MKKIKTLLVLILLTLLTKVEAQEKIYFPYFEMINVENTANLQNSTSKLLKTYIEDNHNNYMVIIPKKEEGAVYVKEDFLESIENAKKSGATYLLIGEINNIGKVAILSLTLYDVSSGNKIWKDMIKGLPLDDYDPVMSRIGRNFATNIKAKDDGSIDDVTAYEQEKELNLINNEASSFTGILLGGNYLFNETFNTRIGINFYYDISSIILYMNIDYSSNTMLNFLFMDDPERKDILKCKTADFGMGVTYPFNKKKNAFYASAAMNLGLISQKRESPVLSEKGAGLDFYIGAGYLIGRNSTSNVRFDVGIAFPTYNVNNTFMPSLKFGIITSFATIKRKK